MLILVAFKVILSILQTSLARRTIGTYIISIVWNDINCNHVSSKQTLRTIQLAEHACICTSTLFIVFCKKKFKKTTQESTSNIGSDNSQRIRNHLTTTERKRKSEQANFKNNTNKTYMVCMIRHRLCVATNRVRYDHRPPSYRAYTFAQYCHHWQKQTYIYRIFYHRPQRKKSTMNC